MRIYLAAWLLLCASAAAASPYPAVHVPPPKNLVKALDPDFSFRKFKIFTLSNETLVRAKVAKNQAGPDTQSKFSSKSGVQEASINFERAYRLYGAVTAYDQRERWGQYFDFFWRVKRPADVTVIFEYKQEKLRAFVQAQEIHYPNAKGTVHSPFRVVGDEFNDDGQILAWRCVLVANGRIVAEKRSFLWD